MPTLKPCPVCGKEPMIKYEYYPSGIECTIRCKPTIWKAHKKVVAYNYGGWKMAFLKAAALWNEGWGTYYE